MHVRRPCGSLAATALVALLGGCAAPREAPVDAGPAMTAEEARATIAARIPASVVDRKGWATDIHAAFASLGIPLTVQNVCAVIAVTGQESGFRANPEIPGLPAIAAREIERQRERAGIPKVVLQAALAVPSSNGVSYGDRLARVRTELDLSEIYEDFIGRVPLAQRFLADRNPVRTAGPMQVSVAFAQAHAGSKPYPYPVGRSIRAETFTRRGGMYFGIAHLLDYPAGYERMIHRFADFNAGHYASRNAAFQKAVSEASGVPLELDGDLLRLEGGRPAKEPGATESAVRALGERLRLDTGDIRDDLEKGDSPAFERTRTWTRLFELAERRSGKRLPRAIVPGIALKGAKITRPLTTSWFANRVETRFNSCMAR